MQERKTERNSQGGGHENTGEARSVLFQASRMKYDSFSGMTTRRRASWYCSCYHRGLLLSFAASITCALLFFLLVFADQGRGGPVRMQTWRCVLRSGRTGQAGGKEGGEVQRGATGDRGERESRRKINTASSRTLGHTTRKASRLPAKSSPTLSRLASQCNL